MTINKSVWSRCTGSWNDFFHDEHTILTFYELSLRWNWFSFILTIQNPFFRRTLCSQFQVCVSRPKKDYQTLNTLTLHCRFLPHSAVRTPTLGVIVTILGREEYFDTFYIITPLHHFGRSRANVKPLFKEIWNENLGRGPKSFSKYVVNFNSVPVKV